MSNFFMREVNAIDDILNQRYNNTNNATDNSDYCENGIVLHVIEDIGDTWYPPVSTENSGRVSFSYLRKDITFGTEFPIWGTFDYSNFVHGYIFAPSTGINYNALCFYPLDAYSWNRKYCGCGETVENIESDEINCIGMTNPSTCANSGVITAQQFIDMYTINDLGEAKIDQGAMCSFYANDKLSFQEAIEVIPKLIAQSYKDVRNNELIIKQWRDTPVDEIPIEVFFYVKTLSGGFTEDESRKKAFTLREAYYKVSGRFLNVVSIDMDMMVSGDISGYLTPFKIEELDKK